MKAHIDGKRNVLSNFQSNDYSLPFDSEDLLIDIKGFSFNEKEDLDFINNNTYKDGVHIFYIDDNGIVHKKENIQEEKGYKLNELNKLIAKENMTPILDKIKKDRPDLADIIEEKKAKL